MRLFKTIIIASYAAIFRVVTQCSFPQQHCMTTQRKTAKETRGAFHYAKFSRNFDPNLNGTVWPWWKFSGQSGPPLLIGQKIEQNHIPTNRYSRLSLVNVKESCTFTLGSSILNLPPHPYMDDHLAFCWKIFLQIFSACLDVFGSLAGSRL